jgi:glycosyltransferase involved in cell wall biosynthesis
MKVLIALTYYRPHVSGLTIYVERLARGLAERGHIVTVLTSQYQPDLPLRERVDGVRVLRVPVIKRVGKGVLMPSLGLWATRLARTHDVLSIHLPQFDAPGLALRGRLFGKPAVLTYHCDLQLPPGRFSGVIDRVVHGANSAAARMADRVIAYTQDYADHSALLSRFPEKIVVIPPPVVMPAPEPAGVEAFQQAHGLIGRPVLGFAARFAAEKGIEHLVDAMPALLARFPNLKVLFAGPYRGVLGEEDYWAWLAPRIQALGEHWEFLGTLRPEQLPPFYGALDCLLVTSVNSTESFGLVQVEAMLCGTPVVATDLPGVRQPVRMTGMGENVQPADSAALADAVTRVLQCPDRYARPRAEIERRFDLAATLDAYEALFEQLLEEKLRARTRR